jgi:hypothetical protein
MRLLFLKSRVRGDAASRQPRNSKQALAMRQKLIEFLAQIPLFLESKLGAPLATRHVRNNNHPLARTKKRP